MSLQALFMCTVSVTSEIEYRSIRWIKHAYLWAKVTRYWVLSQDFSQMWRHFVWNINQWFLLSIICFNVIFYDLTNCFLFLSLCKDNKIPHCKGNRTRFISLFLTPSRTASKISKLGVFLRLSYGLKLTARYQEGLLQRFHYLSITTTDTTKRYTNFAPMHTTQFSDNY